MDVERKLPLDPLFDKERVPDSLAVNQTIKKPDLVVGASHPCFATAPLTFRASEAGGLLSTSQVSR
jgi:hypothetical protein